MSVSLYLKSNYRQATNKTTRYLTIWEGKLYKQKIYDSDPQCCCNKRICFEWHFLNSNKKLGAMQPPGMLSIFTPSLVVSFMSCPQTSFKGTVRIVSSLSHINLKDESSAFSMFSFSCRHRQGRKEPAFILRKDAL